MASACRYRPSTLASQTSRRLACMRHLVAIRASTSSVAKIIQPCRRVETHAAQTEAPARAVAPAQPTNTGMAAGGRVQVNTEHTGISDRSSTRLHALQAASRASISSVATRRCQPRCSVWSRRPRPLTLEWLPAAAFRSIPSTRESATGRRPGCTPHRWQAEHQCLRWWRGGPGARASGRAAQPANTGMAAGGRVQVNTEHTGISDRSSTRLHAPPVASRISTFSVATRRCQPRCSVWSRRPRPLTPEWQLAAAFRSIPSTRNQRPVVDPAARPSRRQAEHQYLRWWRGGPGAHASGRAGPGH